MDRRTLIFVVALSLTFLGVDYFFSQRNIETAKQERAEFRVKQEKELSRLNELVSQKTAKENELPLVTIYQDQGSQTKLTAGIKTNGTIITTSWSDSLPEQVYVDRQLYTLAYQPSTIGGPALYESKKESKLPIGSLPYFGSFTLQLVTLEPTIHITVGEYIDGHFTLPVRKKAQILKLLGEDTTELTFPGDAVVLMNADKGYLPVAIYHSKTESLTYLEQISNLQTEITKPLLPESNQDSKEQYYVLENETQQLVFSNRGGSLVEINLPFESDSHPDSIVKEIETDRNLINEFPYDSHFPNYSYKTADGQEHAKGKLGGYTPLLRRDFIQKGNKKSIQILPANYATNIISDYPEMAELLYTVSSFDKDHITFEARQRNRKITKTYSFDKDTKKAPYTFNLSVNIEGDSHGLWLTSGVPEVEWISNAPAPALKFRLTKKGSPTVEDISLPKESFTNNSDYPDWLSNSNGFFGVILDPLSEIQPGLRAQFVSGTVAPSRLAHFQHESDKYSPEKLPGYMTMLPLNSKGGKAQFRIFAGPFAKKTLALVDKTFTNETTGYTPDYLEAQSDHGWFQAITSPISKFLLFLMQFFYAITGSWGLSIILLTVALRVMLFPLNAWSMKSMMKMQEIGPETKRIQEKYKNDPKKMQLEIMNLYRDRGVNPVSGCFPMLIQLPFLFGMFSLLKNSFELRGASFIPGWIDNLAAPDVLFSWNTPIIFIGNQFHLLPILVGLSMLAQQKFMSPGSSDASEMTEQQRQARASGTIMSVVITVMFYHFPSGLNIYWLSSTLLGMLQQWWTQKQAKNKPIVLKP